VWLLPENTEFEPIRVDLKEEPLLIEGIVGGVWCAGARASGFDVEFSCIACNTRNSERLDLFAS